MVSISAKEQTGMDDLEETIKEMFFSGEVTFNDEVYITNIRHKTSLQEALRSLHLVLQSIADDMPEDILRNTDKSKSIPPLYGALIKNEQDVQLLERLAFMSRR
jgi:tRNA U34 5-carboxymethylaminomethyl modifying GTPase MnmE/TrmE